MTLGANATFNASAAALSKHGGPMTRFDEDDVPPVRPIRRVRALRPVRIPPRVRRPVRRPLAPASLAVQRWRARQMEPMDAPPEAPAPEEREAPETYGCQGEVHHAGSEGAPVRHLLHLEG